MYIQCTYIHQYTHKYTHACIHTHTHTQYYTYTFAHTLTHTYMYTYIHRSEMFKNYSDFSPVTLTPGYKYSQSGEQIN